MAYDINAVSDAVNKAANDIIEAVDAGEEGLRDALNLMVNATICYLDGTASTLAEVAEQNYDEASIEDILDWIEA